MVGFCSGHDIYPRDKESVVSVAGNGTKELIFWFDPHRSSGELVDHEGAVGLK